ncbi:nuclear transport factor 2 family protein [Streptomyces sp. FH025]|uniref:nuclear transport factor 2 family protein n=1 Tax=Streptomyces sp. FH025 TaxID=2815937 RepID=UPI001A9F1CE2|nr:nuclear transport factor 2 family protein [Streptomyces sp. FH025]MBO1413279.1 nuclear transport factor 2 family protein [Streptomyces sp. FH025]
MSDLTDLAGRYIAIWNEADDGKRAAAISELFTADATYTDPLAEVAGHEGIGAVIAGARDMFKGLDFKVLGEADSHHDITRFRWELVPSGGGENVVIGFDVLVTDAAGKVKSVYGFLDKVPAGA